MVKMWKRWLVSVFVFVLTFTLAACASSPNNTSSNPEENTSDSTNKAEPSGTEPEKVTLKVEWWGSDLRHQATQEAMKLYSQKFPNVTFEVSFADYGGYWQKIPTMFAADNPPDILQMDSHLLEYAAKGQLADLASINVSDISDGLLASSRVDGVLYGIPLGNNATGIFYNKSVLEKLGVTLPADGWTWDDYFALGREIKGKLSSDKYALFDASHDRNTYDAYQVSQGKGRMITLDGKFNVDKDTFIQWLELHKALREEGVVPPPSITATDMLLDATQDLMVNGTTLFRPLNFAAQTTAFEGLMPGSVDVVTMPKGIGPGSHLQSSMTWAVSKSSSHVEEAKKFIDWFVNDLEAAEILMTSRGIPVSSKVLAHLEPKFTEADKMAVRLIEETAKDPAEFYSVAGWGSWEKDFAVIVQKYMFDQLSADETYEELKQLGEEYELANAQ